MRVLVCGSRGWKESFIVWTVLDGFLYRCEAAKEELTIINGAARGADRISTEWAMVRLDHEAEEYPADWASYGNQAGYIRNDQMLHDGKPDVVVAFRSPGVSKGTDMMCDLARKAGVLVYVVTGGQEDADS